MPDQDLDTRIRDLLARAVADAPPAPELDPAVVPLTGRPLPHRRLVDRRRRRRARHRGRGRSPRSSSSATPTTASASRARRWGPTVAPTIVPAPAPTAVAPTTVATPAPTATPPAAAPSATPHRTAWQPIVTAGTDGVRVLDRRRRGAALPTAASIGLLTPGGSRHLPAGAGSADSPPGDPQISGGRLGREPARPGRRQNRSYRLHDIAPIDGVPTVLYGVRTDGRGWRRAEHTEVVQALSLNPDGQWTIDRVAEVNSWEGGYDRLHSATDGHGRRHGGTTSSRRRCSRDRTRIARRQRRPGHRPCLASSRATPSATSSARARSRSRPTARSIVWMEGDDLVVLDVATGVTSRAPSARGGDALLAALDVQASGRWSARGGAVVRRRRPGCSTARAGRRWPPTVSVPTLDGRLAPSPRLGAAVRGRSTPARRPPTTTLPPGAVGASFVTAGPAGVVRHRTPTAQTLTRSRSRSALETSDGG